jgi:hypothetical protein
MSIHLVTDSSGDTCQVAGPPGRALRMIHLEHPKRPGEAWCGTPVVGVRGHWQIDCVDCADLRKGWMPFLWTTKRPRGHSSPLARLARALELAHDL